MTILPLTFVCLTLAHLGINVSNYNFNEIPPPTKSILDSHAASFLIPTGSARFEDTDLPLKLVYVGSPPDTLTQQQVDKSLERVTATWSSVTCSAMKLSYTGHVDTFDELQDDEIPIAHLNNADSECLQLGNTLRVGAAPCHMAQGKEAGVVLNRDRINWYEYTSGGPVKYAVLQEKPWVDFEAAVTHELGHVLGLNHPDSALYPRASMAGSYRIDAGQRHLDASDRAVLCVLYPSEDSPTQDCATHQDCVQRLGEPGAQCVDLEGLKVCDKEAGQPGDYCADNLLICQDMCVYTALEARTGYCTLTCEQDSDCPSDTWFCQEEEAGGAKFCVQNFAPPASSGCAVTAPDAHQRAHTIFILGALLGVLFGVRRRPLLL